MSGCELILVTSAADPDGYPCGREAEFTCSDCGTAVCDLHAEECEACRLFFCGACMSSHLDEPHAKPSTSVGETLPQRKRA